MLQLWSMLNTAFMLPVMLNQLLFGAFFYYIGKQKKWKKIKTHGFQLAMVVDQYMNVVWLGHPDETISSRTGRAILSGKPKWFIKYLLHPFVDWAAQKFGDGPDHCIRSVEQQLKTELQYEVWKWFKE